jgi:hypothetical protein
MYKQTYKQSTTAKVHGSLNNIIAFLLIVSPSASAIFIEHACHRGGLSQRPWAQAGGSGKEQE